MRYRSRIGALIFATCTIYNVGGAATPGAQTYSYFGQSLVVMEAENFTVAGNASAGGNDGNIAAGWSVQSWAHSNVTRFASTVANTFISRGALLSAPANASADAVATATVTVGTAGAHAVLVRYEAAYRFDTPFRVTVSQSGKVAATAVYGLRKTPKVWAFAAGRATSSLCAPGLQQECRWPYGATENQVWEGTHVLADLTPGDATIELRVDNSTLSTADGRTASRNVDVVMLHPNASDISMRLQKEGNVLAFDGLLSQAGEVFVRVHNYGTADAGNLTLAVPYTYSHSPYFSMHLVLPRGTPAAPASGCTFNGGPLCPTVGPVPSGGTSDWVDVGSAMDAFKTSTWNFAAGNYTITFGVLPDTRAAGSPPFVLGTFDAKGQPLQVIVDASTRSTRRVRPQGADFADVMSRLDAQTKATAKQAWPLPVGGTAPQHLPVFAGTFKRGAPGGGGSHGPGAVNPAYDASQRRFESLFSISPTVGDFDPASCSAPSARAFDCKYIEIRSLIRNTTELSQALQKKYVDTGLAANIVVVSIGDEVALAQPAADDVATFAAWGTGKNLTAADVGCPRGTWDGCVYRPGLNTSATNPRLFYWSNIYAHDYGLEHWRNITKAVAAKLPNARVGANFSPTKYYTDERTGKQEVQGYTGDAVQWVRAFREGAMTLPWSEDWVWQTPVGTQQMTTLLLDVFRAGLRRPGPSGDSNPPATSKATPPILMYTMAHFPGNHPVSWTRQFWGHLSHGMKMLDLFNWVTSVSGYTCDYVDADGGSYEAVRASLAAVGTFDDIIVGGVAQARGAKAALLYSETADVYYDGAGTAGAEKRALYIALRHAQMPVDVVLETDIEAGELSRLGYAALYVTEPHVRASTARAIAAWVERQGGAVFASAGGGLLDEYNQTNTAMADLLGIDTSTGRPPAIFEGRGTDPDSIGVPSPGPRPVQYVKQDLPFAPQLDTVTGDLASPFDEPMLGAFGSKSIFTLRPEVATNASHTRVLRRFVSDGTPALVRRAFDGGGSATYAAFLPGLAYFHRATPQRPVDRSSSAFGFNHFVPSQFAWGAREIIAAPLEGVAGAQPVVCSEPLVEAGIIARDGVGTAITLINWSGEAEVNGLNVTLRFDPGPVSHFKLASGGALKSEMLPRSRELRFTLDLGLADAIVLRP